MPTPISVSIEPRLVASVGEALLTIYAAQADALHHATNDHLAHDGAFEDLDQARRALWETEAALDGVGWRIGEAVGTVELSGSPALVHDTLTSTVIAAAEHLAETCREYTRARSDLAAVREAFERLTAAHALFDRHEHEHTL
jgi:hypothetical protein